MDPRRPYSQQNQNPSALRRGAGRASTDARDYDIAAQAPYSHRILPSVSNRGQEGSSTNRVVRQHETDGRPHQPPQPPIPDVTYREGKPTATQSHGTHNPEYRVPRNMPQQVQSPTRPRGEWTAPPPNVDTGRERDNQWGQYNPVPPTPQREQVADGAQGLNTWHHGMQQSLPQHPGNTCMQEYGANFPRALTINVPFSREPPDLTAFVEKTGQYADRHGGYADVWKCIYREDNGEGEELVAVKCIRLLGGQSQREKDKAIRRLRREVYVWVELTPHKHVLPLYGTVNGFGHLPALVSPWAENDTLTNYVGSDRRPLSYDKKLTIILQVISGLQHLHSSNICHGDLTGSNVLIDRNGDALISDFGLSTIVAEFDHASYFKSCKPGALRWTDPQLFIDSMENNDSSLPTADIKNDIYSMGCIILQTLTGLVPYHDMNGLAVQIAKCKGQNPTIPSVVSRTLANLMEGCWDSDRPANVISPMIQLPELSPQGRI
ncbi:kinase-like domain-containing protein [Pisolithus marmoratus]|nr:kinase-like domain-containing protein [Pisolithus marmoratus]